MLAVSTLGWVAIGIGIWVLVLVGVMLGIYVGSREERSGRRGRR